MAAIELLAGNMTQLRDDAGQHARRPDVGVLVERLADGEP